MGKFDSFVALKNFIQGKINAQEFVNSDKSIYRVQTNPEDLGQSIIKFQIDDSNLFKLIGLSDDDIWFYQSVNSPYRGSHVYDYDTSLQDFNEGYGLWDELDDDNWEKMQFISNFIMKKPFSQDNDFLRDFADELTKLFPKMVNNLISSYGIERNNQMEGAAQEIIDKDLDDYFSRFGAQNRGNDSISFKAEDLLEAYVETGKIGEPFEKIIKHILRKNGSPEGGWSDSIWEYQSSEGFDTEYFNKEVSSELDSIIEKLSENEEEAKKFIEMVKRVSKKFSQGVWYHLPKDRSKSVTFSVYSFDYPQQKIRVKLRKDLKMKEFSMTEENFNNLLYQPELFQIGELYNF